MSWLDRFRKQPPETRASATDVLVSAIQASAAGVSTENASAIAAIEVAAGMWSRAFAAATVKPQTLETRAITPAIMASIGRQLVMRGQSLHALMVERGQVRLDPIGYWDIKGDSPNEDDWIVSRSILRADRIIQPDNLSQEHSELPLFLSSLLSRHGAYLQWTSRLQLESWRGISSKDCQTRLEVRRGISFPCQKILEGKIKSRITWADLRSDLTNLKGRVGLVESSAGGWGDPGARPKKRLHAFQVWDRSTGGRGEFAK